MKNQKARKLAHIPCLYAKSQPEKSIVPTHNRLGPCRVLFTRCDLSPEYLGHFQFAGWLWMFRFRNTTEAA